MRKTQKKNKTIKSVFTSKNYKSGDGMLTTIWGPSLWHYLHTMSFNYPNNPTKIQKVKYRSFIMNLKYTLPCKYCRINLNKNFKCLPLTMKHMKNRYTFSKYVYNLHEHINRMLHKESGLSYSDVRERYEHFRARCTKKELKEKIFKIEHSKKITMKKINKKNKTQKQKENGCIEPLYGEKSKCILKIVPQKTKCKTFAINEKCKKKRMT